MLTINHMVYLCLPHLQQYIKSFPCHSAGAGVMIEDKASALKVTYEFQIAPSSQPSL